MGITLPHFKRYIRDKVNSHNSNWTHHPWVPFFKNPFQFKFCLMEKVAGMPEKHPWDPLSNYDFPWFSMVVFGIDLRLLPFQDISFGARRSRRVVEGSVKLPNLQFWRGRRYSNFQANFWSTELMDDEDDDGDGCYMWCFCVCVFEGMFFWWGSNGRFTLENKDKQSKELRCFAVELVAS